MILHIKLELIIFDLSQKCEFKIRLLKYKINKYEKIKIIR